MALVNVQLVDDPPHQRLESLHSSCVCPEGSVLVRQKLEHMVPSIILALLEVRKALLSPIAKHAKRVISIQESLMFVQTLHMIQATLTSPLSSLNGWCNGRIGTPPKG